MEIIKTAVSDDSYNYVNDSNKNVVDIEGFFLFVDILINLLKIYIIFLYWCTK